MIIETIKKLKNVSWEKPADDKQIEEAEKALNLEFSPEYIRYLKTFGCISAFGTELTGIIDLKRLNVVDSTKRERALNSKIPENMYLIENSAIDGIIWLQDETGAIYLGSPCAEPKLSFGSLEEYLKMTKYINETEA